MLGRFHEISIETDDIRASVEFYEKLGFTHAPTTDTWPHPYGVLTDGRLFIGLHRREVGTPTLTFVHPGTADRAAAFTSRGIELELLRSGDESFNEIAFRSPEGQRIAVLEARTYSPVSRSHADTSLCGYFTEFSIPTPDFAAAKQFWEPLGFVATEDSHIPYPHLCLTSDHLNLAFHHPRTYADSLLVFTDPNMPDRIAALGSRGIAPARSVLKGTIGGTNALIFAPEGTALLLLDETLALEAGAR